MPKSGFNRLILISALSLGVCFPKDSSAVSTDPSPSQLAIVTAYSTLDCSFLAHHMEHDLPNGPIHQCHFLKTQTDFFRQALAIAPDESNLIAWMRATVYSEQTLSVHAEALLKHDLARLLRNWFDPGTHRHLVSFTDYIESRISIFNYVNFGNTFGPGIQYRESYESPRNSYLLNSQGTHALYLNTAASAPNQQGYEFALSCKLDRYPRHPATLFTVLDLVLPVLRTLRVDHAVLATLDATTDLQSSHIITAHPRTWVQARIMEKRLGNLLREISSPMELPPDFCKVESRVSFLYRAPSDGPSPDFTQKPFEEAYFQYQRERITRAIASSGRTSWLGSPQDDSDFQTALRAFDRYFESTEGPSFYIRPFSYTRDHQRVEASLLGFYLRGHLFLDLPADGGFSGLFKKPHLSLEFSGESVGPSTHHPDPQLLVRLDGPYRALKRDIRVHQKLGSPPPGVAKLKYYSFSGTEHHTHLFFDFYPSELDVLITNPVIRTHMEKFFQGIEGFLTGIHGLHKRGWIHRDVKPENGLYTEQPKAGEFESVISDLGTATNEFPALDWAGTPRHMAPELFTRWIEHQHVIPTFQDGVLADVYATGMSLFFLFFWETDGVEQFNALAKLADPISIHFAAGRTPNEMAPKVSELIALIETTRTSQAPHCLVAEGDSTNQKFFKQWKTWILEMIDPDPLKRKNHLPTMLRSIQENFPRKIILTRQDTPEIQVNTFPFLEDADFKFWIDPREWTSTVAGDAPNAGAR